MKEEDAKQKWCPMVRCAAGIEDNNAANCGETIENRNPPFARCIGSECMMWRNLGKNKGFCGLGGNP